MGLIPAMKHSLQTLAGLVRMPPMAAWLALLVFMLIGIISNPIQLHFPAAGLCDSHVAVLNPDTHPIASQIHIPRDNTRDSVDLNVPDGAPKIEDKVNNIPTPEDKSREVTVNKSLSVQQLPDMREHGNTTMKETLIRSKT